MDLTKDLLLGPLAKCRTADQVARLFRKNEVTGDPGSCQTCPVAVFLFRRLERLGVVRDPYVEVFDCGQALVYSQRGWRVKYKLTLPPAVDEFIERFDNGEFPDLQERR